MSDKIEKIYGKARIDFYAVRNEVFKMRKQGLFIKNIYNMLIVNKKISMHYKTFWVYVDMFENPEKYNGKRKKRNLPIYLHEFEKKGGDDEK